MPKKYPKNKPSKHATVRLPKEMVDAIEEFLETEPAKKSGFLHITDVVTEATRHLLKDLGYYPPESRFKHFNVYEDHVTIMDNKLERMIDVYFRNEKPYCQYCGKHDCIHVRFAINIPKVYKALKERGFPIPKDLITEN